MAKACSKVLVGSALMLAACNDMEAPTVPTSPGGTTTPAVSLAPAVAPQLVEPSPGAEFAPREQPVILVVNNLSASGGSALSYVFEVSTDSAFGSRIVADRVAQGDGGQTRFTLPESLAPNADYFWRVRAQSSAGDGPFSAPSRFRIRAAPSLGVPVPLNPVQGTTIAHRRAIFTIRNSDRSGEVGQVWYTFEVGADAGLGNKIAVVTLQEQAEQTSFELAQELEYSRSYFWRARAFDSLIASDWTGIMVFSAPSAPAPEPPQQEVAGRCYGSQPFDIVACHRSRYGFMSDDELIEFLTFVARDLNFNSVWGGGFGILRKGSGTSCRGYSCDIVCRGQGGGQEQYDVLGDIQGAQTAGWAGPLQPFRADVCEVQ